MWLLKKQAEDEAKLKEKETLWKEIDIYSLSKLNGQNPKSTQKAIKQYLTEFVKTVELEVH